MDARTFAKKKIAEAIHHFHFFFNLTRHLFSAITITQREKWRLSPKNPEAAAAAPPDVAPGGGIFVLGLGRPASGSQPH